MITAPYNFVPLNKEVFYPDWDKDVSHDVPFEDGESGVIDINISAQTALYIRNHYIEGDDYYLDNKNNKISTEFCHFKDETGAKQYYIPGSSLKGMIRNIVEIMSFSKINIDEKTLKKPLSVRDMTQDKKTGEIFNHDMVVTAKKCGFLVQDGEDYFIEDCGNVLTIRDSEIQMQISDYTKEISTAQEKYETFGHIDFPFSTEVQGERNTTVAVYDNNSKKYGKLVMTGAIDNKKNEFIFHTNGRKIALKQSLFDNFEKVYFLNEDAIDGQYWKKEFQNSKSTRIPIFYTQNRQNEITHIGLTQIFKVAYTHTLFDAIKQSVDETRLDLAETIFGTVRGKNLLKGRVQFSHIKSTHVTYEREKSEILGSPQATYYPNYIRQTNANAETINKYITLMDNSVEIAGYKRYPLHKNTKRSFIPKEEKTDIQTKFKPLSKGSEFQGKLRFHNLKKAEIGALLSALTFHGNDACLHNIGMAKSLGFGKIKIDVTLNGLQHTQESYLEAFEKEMSIFQEGWIESPQLVELFAMSSNNIISDQSLEYQKLENPKLRGKEKNDFTLAKKSKKYLNNYSKIGNVEQLVIKSFINAEELEQEKEQRRKEKERLVELEKEKKAKELLESQQKEQQLKKQAEELSKWEKIHHPSVSKYLKEALTKFIEDYPASEKLEKAKEELKALSDTSKAYTQVQNLDFSSATDIKSLERAMKPINQPSDDDKAMLIEAIKTIYPSLNTKKQGQFKRSKLIPKWLGKDWVETLS